MEQSGVAVLLVDDDPDVAEMFRLGLTIAGHDVEVTGDGGSAFERASQKRFDLVFLDVQLPGIDGLTTLARLRSNPSTRDMAVAMLTNSDDETHRWRAGSLRIVEWLVKSETTPSELARRVSAWTQGGGEVTPEKARAWAAASSRELSNNDVGESMKPQFAECEEETYDRAVYLHRDQQTEGRQAR
jgi:DNA-binding response OmpR family regulator